MVGGVILRCYVYGDGVAAHQGCSASGGMHGEVHPLVRGGSKRGTRLVEVVPVPGDATDVNAKDRAHPAGVANRQRQDQLATELDLRGLWHHREMHWLKHELYPFCPRRRAAWWKTEVGSSTRYFRPPSSASRLPPEIGTSKGWVRHCRCVATVDIMAAQPACLPGPDSINAWPYWPQTCPW